MTFEDNHATETFRSLITLATEGLKALVLLNGGAVVALLAYLGQANTPSLAHGLARPFTFFIAGLTLAVLAFFTAYGTQLALFNETQKRPPLLNVKSDWWLLLTMAVALGSVVAFARGAFAGLGVLGTL